MKWDIVPSTEEVTLLMEAGMIYRDTGKFEEARDVFTGVRALMPQSEVPEVMLGSVAAYQQDFTVAQKHYQRALETNPKSAFALVHLGELALAQKNSAEARTNFKKAMELDPRGDVGKTARGMLEMTEVLKLEA